MSFFDRYGFAACFAEQVQDASLRPARVVTCNRNMTRLATEAGERTGMVSGRFSYMALSSEDYPCVGDWVLARDAGDGPLIIERLLERKSVIKRKAAGTGSDAQLIAANVDTAFIVQSCNQDLNLRRLERYIATCRQDGVTVVIVLNKADLLGDRVLPEIPASWATPVLIVTATTGQGFEELGDFLQQGTVSVFVGSSGVGKSTLINRLGEIQQATQDIRSGDDKGRHTTTQRELFFAKQGGMIIDTPGMRELGVIDTDIEESGLFDDIATLAKQCHYRDCQHQSEPGCAVVSAIAEGTLDEGRLRGLRKLQREEAFHKRRSDAKSQYDTKKRWKNITKQMRKHPKTQR